jgi:hypothetical protein
MIWLGIGIGLIVGGVGALIYVAIQFAKGMNW